MRYRQNFFKYGGEALHRQIDRIYYMARRKKYQYDGKKAFNSRRISLINTAYKVPSNILLIRLTPYAETSWECTKPDLGQTDQQ